MEAKVMTPKEIGMMIKALRDGKEVICPECKTGKIITPYNPKTSTYFNCTTCNFRIHMEPAEKR